MSVDKSSTERSGKFRQVAKPFLSYLIAIVCLIWVFHNIKIGLFLKDLGNIRWNWIILAIICDFLSYLFQGLRWRILLKPVSKVSLWKSTQAIYSGLFTNEILPFRTGEIVRTYLISRWTGISFVTVIPSILVERFFDAIWIGIGVGLTAIFAELPHNLVDAAEILGIAILTLVTIFIYLVLRRERELIENPDTKNKRKPLLGIVGTILTRLASGIKAIGTSRYFYFAFTTSSLILVFQILSFWLVMLAYRFSFSLWAGAAVMIIVLLGTAIPNTPSNVGTYQFFVVVGLTLFGVEKTTASGFSLVVFVILTIPLWALGFIAISKTGMKLSDIRREVSDLIKRRKKIEEMI
jgi:glycosyltransferase 2 family protein